MIGRYNNNTMMCIVFIFRARGTQQKRQDNEQPIRIAGNRTLQSSYPNSGVFALSCVCRRRLGSVVAATAAWHRRPGGGVGGVPARRVAARPCGKVARPSLDGGAGTPPPGRGTPPTCRPRGKRCRRQSPPR